MALVRPLPRPDPLSQGFWDAAANGVLAIQRCAACGTYQHLPRPICRACTSIDLAFAPVSGQARLWGWTTTHHAVIAGFEEALPYTCLVVELAEQSGLFLLSDLADRPSFPLRLGMPMRAVFPPVAEGAVLPQFVPAGDAA